MKYLLQFLIIIAFSFAGELLHWLLPLPIPASIYGIVLLFISLEVGIVKTEHIRETGNFLIAIMPILFLPPAVGVLGATDLLAQNWLQYAIVIVVSTFVVMAATGLATQFVIRKQKNRK